MLQNTPTCKKKNQRVQKLNEFLKFIRQDTKKSLTKLQTLPQTFYLRLVVSGRLERQRKKSRLRQPATLKQLSWMTTATQYPDPMLVKNFFRSSPLDLHLLHTYHRLKR